jgi:hypothetical protein
MNIQLEREEKENETLKKEKEKRTSQYEVIKAASYFYYIFNDDITKSLTPPH